MLATLSQKYGPLMTIMIIFTFVTGTESFKILILYPTPSFSHQRPMLALAERLVNEGHELFVVSPNVVPGLENHVNYTYADVSFAYEQRTDEKKGVPHYQRQGSKWDIASLMGAMFNVVRRQFESRAFLQFKLRLESEKIKFDVVIVQSYLLPYLAPMARILAADAPIIAMSSFQTDEFSEDIVGSTVHHSFVPFILGHYTDKMNLWQKLENWISHHYCLSSIRKTLAASSREFFQKNYGLREESLVDSWWKNISLTLITSNSLYFYPRLLSPNIIEVGPLHLEPPQKLPKNLQDWLDGADKGVIYFSLGNNMKSTSLAKNVLENFLKFFRELPPGYRILWKWEVDEKIPGQPDNIMTQKWMPQDSVLAHPKVRVFITQGGLQSFQEAVHFAVPTVGIPWFVDQECVTAKMVDAKIGVKLSPQEITSFTKIKAAIELVLFDESYLQNMRRLSAVSHDFTSAAMDKAVFWVEHVARHRGASHLRPSSANASLFEFSASILYL